MERIQQVVEGNVLDKLIPMPKSMRDGLVEITIVPLTQATPKPKPHFSRNELRELLGGSHTESLTGILQVPHDISLKELRAERRGKYERDD